MSEATDTSGFYKNDGGALIHGPKFVLNANYELRRETHNQHNYPVDGWYWFDSEGDARAHFGLPAASALDAQTWETVQ